MYQLFITAPAFLGPDGGVEVRRFESSEAAYAAYFEARRAGQAADLYEVIDGRLRLVSPAGEGADVVSPHAEPRPYDWLDAAEPVVTYPFDDWVDEPPPHGWVELDESGLRDVMVVPQMADRPG